MEAERWGRVKALFQDVFERDPAERAQLLQAACVDDPGLREEVERLLRGHSLPGALDFAPERGAPARIGPYRVLRELGRGGMGTVYLALRDDEPGLSKTVAVKVVRPERASAFVVGRFHAERRLLAGLEHPGIARLYDGGTTAEGLPYFVMEYVDGDDLLAYCDGRRLPIAARLRLLLRVCDAVQYAHQNLVVHRDLKPSNILVTADGDPKLLDFGIAKLLSPPSAEEGTEETASVIRLMTPDYASPEQFRGERVTTATDVYSLGVITYHLLSGRRPRHLRGAPEDEAQRALARDPEPPSAAAGSRKLRQMLRGDLDNIVLKALRPDPAERYATAAELGEDLRRHLEGFPVRARRDGAAYRLAKFLRRHRAGAAAAAVAVASLVTGLGVALHQAQVAEAERRRAAARFEDVRRLAHSVIYELHDAIANLPGATAARQLMVARAIEYLDRLALEARGDVALQRELADAYQRVAQVQGGGLGANLGDSAGALESYRKALAIRQSLVQREPVDAKDLLGLALLENDVGALRRALGQAAEAENALQRAATRLEELKRAGTLSEGERSRLGGVYQRLAEARSYQGRSEEALRTAEQAVAEAEAGWKAAAEDGRARSILAASSYQLGAALAGVGRHAEALDRHRRARGLLEDALEENPLDARQTSILLFVLNGESSSLRQTGDLRGALQVREHALQVAQGAADRDPRDRWSQLGVAVAARELGVLLLEAGDVPASTRRLRQALAITRPAVAADPQYTFARLEVASAEYGLGRALVLQGSGAGRAEGCAALARVRAFWTGLRSQGQLPPGETEELQALAGWLARCPGRQ